MVDLVDLVLERHFCVHPQCRFGKWAKAQCLVCVRVCVRVHAFRFVEWSLISGKLHAAFYKQLITASCYGIDRRTIIVLSCFCQ